MPVLCLFYVLRRFTFPTKFIYSSCYDCYCRCRLDRQAAWAGWSGVPVGRHVMITRLTLLTGEGKGGRREKEARDKITKRTSGKEGVEWGRGQGPVGKGRTPLRCLYRGPEFLLTPLVMVGQPT